MSNDRRAVIGIDLGTTHCVLAHVAVAAPSKSAVFAVTQLTAPGEIRALSLLPSFVFLPGEADVPAGGLALPWNEKIDYAVGEFALHRGAELPHRCVSSAKSWLGHSGVSRTEPILPWNATDPARRISPVEATARLLGHLKDAWNHQATQEGRDEPLEAQAIYLTVPASFDAVARELTVQAAQMAGLPSLTLLEEPQAAFYAWIEAQGDAWRQAVRVGETILVCDVGGGTTDFSLFQVAEEQGELALRRVAVGDHILLGGDNMDLALAFAMRSKLVVQGAKLDHWQFRALVYQCRKAKERLLGPDGPAAEPVVILGRGSALIGQTLRTELTRQEVEQILLEGFCPSGELTDTPRPAARMGIREIGLPYDADPAVTRHLAGFLHRHVGAQGADSAVAFPAAVLFNGGVMKSPLLQQRLLGLLSKWSGQGVRLLASRDLDLAVSRGATYYGQARRGLGIRIRAGAARSYYIGVESAMPAVPGVPTPVKALCVVPYGMEEGTQVELRDQDFGLALGEPALFALLSSSVRKADPLGAVVEDWAGEIEEITTLQVDLPAEAIEAVSGRVPVWLACELTEVGTLSLWAVARESDQRWKLTFQLQERKGA